MDTINMAANGQSISFSTKSLTINNEEFLYTRIKAIKHSSAKHLYLFKYEGTWHNLYYNEEDQEKVAAIFKRVAAMNAKRAQTSEPETEAKATDSEAEEPTTENKPEAEDAAKAEAPEEATEEAAVEAAEEKSEDAETNTGDDASEKNSEAAEEKTEKKKKLKKSIIVLIIIILVFVAAGIAYFFVLGPSNDASQGNNTNSTHQYDDIEELIDEMQE